MVWQWIERVTHLTFLILAIVLVFKLSDAGSSSADVKAFSLEVGSLKSELKDTITSSATYFEKRVNAVSGAQDEYQISTTAKLTVIEGRLSTLENENRRLKQQQKTIINNSNTINN